LFCSRTSSRVSRRIDVASSHAERLSLRRARFPDRRAPWYCLRVRCTRPVRCKRVRGSWTDHHSSWAVTAQPRHAVQLQIVNKLSTIGGPVSWLDKLAPTRYIRRADSLMFIGSFRPAGVLTEKELCLGRPLLLTFITVITVESNRLQGAGSLRFIRYLDGLGFPSPFSPRTFRWVSRLSEWDAPSTREPCQRGRLCPRSGRLDTRCSKRHRAKRPQTQARMVSGNEEVCYG